MPPDDSLCAIEKHSIRFAGLFILHDFAAEWTGRVLIDAGDFDGGAVDHNGVPVGASQGNGIVWRNLVEVPSRGKCLRLPESLDPPAPGYPFARLRAIHSFFHHRQKLFEAGSAFKVQGHLARADSRKVVVRIGHARNDGVAAEIDYPSALALISACVLVRSDKDNL